jgi:hypothetical protein
MKSVLTSVLSTGILLLVLGHANSMADDAAFGETPLSAEPFGDAVALDLNPVSISDIALASALNQSSFDALPESPAAGHLDTDTMAATSGGKIAEGFVAPYGAIRVGGGAFQYMAMFQARFPHNDFFEHGKLTFVRNYCDSRWGVYGSLYCANLCDGTRRFFLLEAGHPHHCCHQRRRIIAYNEHGLVISRVVANYRQSCH